MTTYSPQQHDLERRFRKIVANAGLPEPDDAAVFERALVFLWHDRKAFVLIDLDGIPAGVDPLDRMEPVIDGLRSDLMGLAYGNEPDFAEAA